MFGTKSQVQHGGGNYKEAEKPSRQCYAISWTANGQWKFQVFRAFFCSSSSNNLIEMEMKRFHMLLLASTMLCTPAHADWRRDALDDIKATKKESMFPTPTPTMDLPPERHGRQRMCLSH